MNMKKITICLLALVAALVSCKKDDVFPSPEEKLKSAAGSIFNSTAVPSVDLLDFCLDFQAYLDASADDKILEKYKPIRKSVSKEGENSYEVTAYDLIPSYGKFTADGKSVNEPGAKFVFDDLGATVTCTGTDEWEIRVSRAEGKTAVEVYSRYTYFYSSEDVYEYVFLYRKTSSDELAGTVSLEGTLKSKGSKTYGYTASYRTEGEFKHLGGTSFSGAFKMETFDASGTPLHSCTLNL